MIGLAGKRKDDKKGSSDIIHAFYALSSVSSGFRFVKKRKMRKKFFLSNMNIRINV